MFPAKLKSFCGYCAQSNLQARWKNKHNKNVLSSLLKWIPRTIHWYHMGHFTGLGSGFTLVSVNPPGIYFIWGSIPGPPSGPPVQRWLLEWAQAKCLMLLTYRANSIFHLQIITMRSFINLIESSYRLLSNHRSWIFSKLNHLLPYCSESHASWFAP